KVMSRSRWLLLVVASFVAAPLTARAGDNAEALDFNNMVSKATKDLEKIGLEFGKNLGKNKDDAAKMKELQAKATKEAGKVIEKGRGVKPPDVPMAAEFHKTFLEYLKAEEKIINEDFAKVVAAFMDNDLQALQKILQEISSYEDGFV